MVGIALLALLALAEGRAVAQQRPAPGFSFAVYGDSRSMMYLPGNSNQKEEATKLLVDMFDLVLPEKVSEEVVRKDVKLIYDPATGKLVQIVMIPMNLILALAVAWASRDRTETASAVKDIA